MSLRKHSLTRNKWKIFFYFWIDKPHTQLQAPMHLITLYLERYPLLLGPFPWHTQCTMLFQAFPYPQDAP